MHLSLPTVDKGKSKERNDTALNLPSGSSTSVISHERPSIEAGSAKVVSSNSSYDFKRNRLVVAIDYGTTCSKAAFAFETLIGADGSQRSNKIIPEAVRKWPGGREVYAVSSKIAYKRHNTELYCKWGFQIPSPDHPTHPTALPDNQGWTTIPWAKITLEDPERTCPDRGAMPGNDDTPPADKSLRIMRSVVSEKLPMHVVSDYLKGIWDHVRKQVEDTLWEGVEYDKTLVLTVPAEWSEHAAVRIHKAARYAGLWGSKYKFLVIKEPEAAAVYLMRYYGTTHSLEEGNCFIVCDAGGGTLDLAVYEVICNGPRNLRLAQRTSSTGSFYGSVYLDQKFDERLKLSLGLERYNSITSEGMEKIMLSWENAKAQFNGEDVVYVQLPFDPPIPELRNNDGIFVMNNLFVLKKNDMEIIFDSVLTQLTYLICGQKDALRKLQSNKVLKAMCLIGGLGTSEYLKQKLKLMHQNSSFQILTLPSETSQMSVCYGAVLTGLDNAIEVTHIAPYHFGYQKSDDSMKWFIQAGTSIKPREIFQIRPRFPVNRFKDIGGVQLSLPLYTGQETEKTDGYYIRDLGTLDFTISRDQFRKLIQESEGNSSADGEMYIYLYVDIILTHGCVTFKYDIDIKKDLSTAKEESLTYSDND